jgi:hypothetical protein
MRTTVQAGFLSAALLLTACTAPPSASLSPAPSPAPSASACAVGESRDWAAWVNRMPGPGATPTLHVTGKVDVPHGGYTVSVREGPADRSATPVQQIILETTLQPGMHTQAIATHDVHYQGPVIAQNYRAIRVMCGGRQLAEITNVTDAH